MHISSETNVPFFTMAEGKLFKGFPCTDDSWLSEITVPECQFAAWGAYLDGEEVCAWEAWNKDVLSLKRPNASVKAEMKRKRSCQSHPSPAMNLYRALQKTPAFNLSLFFLFQIFLISFGSFKNSCSQKRFAEVIPTSLCRRIQQIVNSQKD